MKVDLLDTPREDVRMEIIPLIDVIFCILTFFILAAVGLTRQQAIDLDLPAAQTGKPLPGQVSQDGLADRLYVSVDSLGQIYLDQQPVTVDLLYDVLQQFNQISPTGLIVLYASRDARYEDVVTVLDVLRSVGGDRVALATLPRDINLTTPGAGTSPLPPSGQSEKPVDPFAPNQPSIPFEQPLTPQIAPDLPTPPPSGERQAPPTPGR